MLAEDGPLGQMGSSMCPWCGDGACFGECSPGRLAEPLITAVDVERGAGCPTCGRLFSEGERYSAPLFGFSGDVPITEVVCVSCGLAGNALRGG
jgi:hypothetical protein